MLHILFKAKTIDRIMKFGTFKTHHTRPSDQHHHQHNPFSSILQKAQAHPKQCKCIHEHDILGICLSEVDPDDFMNMREELAPSTATAAAAVPHHK